MKEESGYYERVCVDGHPAYSVDTMGNVYGQDGRILKPYLNTGGYQRVVFCEDGRTQGKTVHRLVAETFVPNPYNKPCVNHVDGNKNNNAAENLEWCTHSENTQHAYSKGLQHSNLTDDDRRRARQAAVEHWSKSVRVVETGEIYPSAASCARAKGIDRAGISRCCNGYKESHCGYHFEWV